jgi:hypothetical protein
MLFLRAGYSLDSNSLYGLTLGAGLRYRITKTLIPRFDVSFVPDPQLGHKLGASFYLNI